ncbi:hypothetical protein [Streptosporangium sp. NPDC051022]
MTIPGGRCTTTGTSAAVTCPRFNRLHSTSITAPTVVEQADARGDRTMWL